MKKQVVDSISKLFRKINNKINYIIYKEKSNKSTLDEHGRISYFE